MNELLTITPVPCLRDNYAYLVTETATGRSAIVDPSEAGPVLDAVEAAGVELEAIWNTHHHWDHVGGNGALLARFPGLAIHGHVSDRGRIAGQTVFHEHGDRLSLGSVEGQVLHVPGHTTGAVGYVIAGEVFTGDTLFQAGCGRLFEGTPAMMYRSLVEILGALPDDTRVWCGHEYTVSSLRYAQHAEPDNAAVAERMAWATDRRDRGLPTVPSTLGQEKSFNPFMRAADVDQLGARRAEKDGF